MFGVGSVGRIRSYLIATDTAAEIPQGQPIALKPVSLSLLVYDLVHLMSPYIDSLSPVDLAPEPSTVRSGSASYRSVY